MKKRKTQPMVNCPRCCALNWPYDGDRIYAGSCTLCRGKHKVPEDLATAYSFLLSTERGYPVHPSPPETAALLMDIERWQTK